MNISFHKRIEQLRKRRELKQYELAKELNVSAPTISAWEAGLKLPSFPMLIKIADYFEVTTDYLLGRDILFSEDKRKEINDLVSDYEKLSDGDKNAVRVLIHSLLEKQN